jgi:hypothetical protein
LVSAVHFGLELRSQLRAAASQGDASVVINSSDLSKSIQMGSSSMDACCEAMQEEVKAGDVVIRNKNSGVGMSVRYQLPRTS